MGKTLGDYIDRLNAGENVDLTDYKSKLSPEQYIEFCQLAPMLSLVKRYC
jgi:hypothetical protein